MQGHTRKWLGLLINYPLAAAAGWFGFEHWGVIQSAVQPITELYISSPAAASDWNSLTLLGLVSAVLGPLAGHAYTRRVKVAGPVRPENYFEEKGFTNCPMARMGYSDRLSYTLAELSDLAYWDAFTEDELTQLARIVGLADEQAPEFADFVHTASQLMVRDNVMQPAEFDAILERGGFERLSTFRKGGTQGFICRHNGGGPDDTNAEPYVVVAFRGTEANIEDWLTDITATPSPQVEHGKVHKGFLDAYKRVEPMIRSVLDAQRREDPDIPVFFTGHSLGGALALVATALNARDSRGGCYTFGAPRLGDYSFFQGVKTPVFRVVNASDIVPRVPPGAWSIVLKGFARLIGFLTARFEHAQQIVVWAEQGIDRISQYRHHGDLRYLPDIASADVDDKAVATQQLSILSNPEYLDVVQWFFRHVGVSFGLPAKSHAMKLYRNKLLLVARTRMSAPDIGEQQFGS